VFEEMFFLFDVFFFFPFFSTDKLTKSIESSAKLDDSDLLRDLIPAVYKVVRNSLGFFFLSSNRETGFSNLMQ
jgi:hypothetical protein